ncbi:MAG: Crp/Fnr family transcriptional regulator [Oscillospiraceae bacterium]
MLTDDDVKLLSSTLTFWSKLAINEKNLILNNVATIKYNRGDNIHRGSNDCVGVLIIKSGTLRTYILSDEGKEITLYRLYAGDVCMLSASCLIKNITFDVHIDATEMSEILLINSSVFAQLIQQNIYVENFSYRITIDRFSDVMWAMEQILFMSFDRRMAIFLIDESAKNNSDIISLTHEQIAKYMGSAREVVSRMLKYFANEGIVEMSRGGVKIIDKVKLRSLS